MRGLKKTVIWASPYPLLRNISPHTAPSAGHPPPSWFEGYIVFSVEPFSFCVISFLLFSSLHVCFTNFFSSSRGFLLICFLANWGILHSLQDFNNMYFTARELTLLRSFFFSNYLLILKITLQYHFLILWAYLS